MARRIGQEFLVDPASVSAPARWLLAGQREADIDLTVLGEPHQLVAIDHIAQRAGRVQQPHRGGAAACAMVAEHRPEGRHARPACDKEQRAAAGRLPDEVAADRAAQLQLVAGAQLVDEEG